MFKKLWNTKVRLVFVILSVTVVVVLMGLAQSGVIGFKTNIWRKPVEKTDITVTVKKTLPISEINGLTVAVEKVIDSEQDGWPIVSGKKMLVVAGWDVKLGIDASKIDISTDESNKTIHADLPALKVISIEQSSKPHIYNLSGSLLDNYSSQDVLDAVDSKSDSVKASVLKDHDYQTQAFQSIEDTLSTMLNSTPGVKGVYKIAYSLPE